MGPEPWHTQHTHSCCGAFSRARSSCCWGESRMCSRARNFSSSFSFRCWFCLKDGSSAGRGRSIAHWRYEFLYPVFCIFGFRVVTVIGPLSVDTLVSSFTGAAEDLGAVFCLGGSLLNKEMPLCSSRVMAIHGGLGFLSRSFCPPGENSYHRRLRRSIVDLGLGLLQHPGVHSTQTWSAATIFHLSGRRLSQLQNWRAMAEQQEQFDAEQRDGVARSSLEHPETNTKLVQANAAPVVATGSIFGAMALITGTSVGAGILALPAITAPIGFIPSATIMGISWAFLVVEALLLAEVNVELMRRREPGKQLLHYSQVVSLRTMADETMGPLGGLFTTVIYLMLSYTLLVAYISKSGEVLSLLLHVPNGVAGVIFTFGLGGLLGVGGAKVADSVNQVLTITLLGLFVLIVLGGAAMADWTGLEHVDWTLAPQTIPIIFLALVYHDLTPVVCAQLGGDIGRIRISIILGSFIPFVMFLSWDALALCITTPLLGAKDPIDVFMRVGGAGPAFVVESFAFLAVATSFIGTVLGLSEFFLEQFGKAQQGMTLKMLSIHRRTPQPFFEWLNSYGPRAISSLLVLAPPLVASSLVTDAFFSASDLAGAYGMTSLYGVIPPLMAWSLTKDFTLSNPEAQTTTAEMAKKPSQSMSRFGGRIALATVGACAVVVIVGQVMLDLPPASSSSPVKVDHQEKIPTLATSSGTTQLLTTLTAP